MSARERILDSIRRANARRSAAPSAWRGEPSSAPAVSATCGLGALWQEFARRAAVAAATAAHVGSPAELPGELARYLRANGLPMRLCAEPGAPAADWASAGIAMSVAPPAADGDTLVTGCFAGIVEEGAIALLSGSGRAVEHAFLAETHIAVLPAGKLVRTLDDLWARLRAHASAATMPRTLNLVLGPSRTADLGVPSRLGAHGPRRLHIVGVGSE
jgi:L-lactate dehydrogenase complex protein LldG